ncbi:MAG: site-specific integrase [Pseudomonadota bacterium]|nr:site-specific integrase [Pseudomonadota bacterium]
MKPTDFAVHLSQFLTHHLSSQRNLSPNTIKAYRDVFMILLRYCRDDKGIALERLCLDQIDVALVESFLDYLEKERHCAIRTQNHRLAALHAFFRYVQSEVPERMLQCQQVLSIPLRRHACPAVSYLSKQQLVAILSQPDLQTASGRRDAVLLSVLYDTGARVQELIDLTAGDVRLDAPAQIRLMGKGRKLRAVPLMEATTQILGDHLREKGLDDPERVDHPLFQNRQGNRLTRAGIRYILQKHVRAVCREHPGFTQSVSPHTLRHTKGMHLLQSGVSLEIIRDFLGHVDIKTTQIYAHANLEMKRKALEAVSGDSPITKIPSWQKNKTLLDWLHTL